VAYPAAYVERVGRPDGCKADVNQCRPRIGAAAEPYSDCRVRVVYPVTNVPRPNQVDALQLGEPACKATGSEESRYGEGENDLR